MSEDRPAGTTCDLCDRPAYDTGRREVRDGRTWRVAHCDGCGDDITFWEAPRPRRLDVRTEGPVATVGLDRAGGALALLFRDDASDDWVRRSVDLATGTTDDAVVAAADAEAELAGGGGASVRPVVRLATVAYEGDAAFAEAAARVERATGRRPVDRLAVLTHGRFEVVDHLVADERGIGEHVVVWGEGARVLELEVTGQREHVSHLVATGRALARPWCLDDWLVVTVDRRHVVLLDLGDGDAATAAP